MQPAALCPLLTPAVWRLLLQLMPPIEVSSNMEHPEAPPTHPCGPNTNFQYPTPMPARFVDTCIDECNMMRSKLMKEEHPIYQTSSSEVGKMGLQASDLPMRWYGLEGRFTNGWAAALPKTRVNNGLNTSMDRSDIHFSFDQGWSGHLTNADFNIANNQYSKHVMRPARQNATGM